MTDITSKGGFRVLFNILEWMIIDTDVSLVSSTFSMDILNCYWQRSKSHLRHDQYTFEPEVTPDLQISHFLHADPYAMF